MVICPIALAVGCRKCPIFKVCPVKSVIGDYKPDEEAPKAAKDTPARSTGAKSRKAAPPVASRRTATSGKGRKAARRR
jgi:hypothetical protein